MAFTLLNSYESTGYDTAFDVVFADPGCTNVVDTSQFAHGIRSKELITTTGSVRAYDSWTSPGALPSGLVGNTFFRIYFRLSAVGSVQVPLIRPLTNTGNTTFLLAVTTASKLIIQDTNGTTINTSTATIAANT